MGEKKKKKNFFEKMFSEEKVIRYFIDAVFITYFLSLGRFFLFIYNNFPQNDILSSIYIIYSIAFIIFLLPLLILIIYFIFSNGKNNSFEKYKNLYYRMSFIVFLILTIFFWDDENWIAFSIFLVLTILNGIGMCSKLKKETYFHSFNLFFILIIIFTINFIMENNEKQNLLEDIKNQNKIQLNKSQNNLSIQIKENKNLTNIGFENLNNSFNDNFNELKKLINISNKK